MEAVKKLQTMIIAGLMIIASLMVFLPTEVAAIPSFGTPEIDPEYPNATEPVNVSIQIDDNQDIVSATLYYSYDSITWFSVNMKVSSGTANPTVGIVQQGATSDYQTLLNNLGISYTLVPDNPPSSSLIGIDILILDGASGGQSTSEIATYQTFYNNGGSIWTSYDDVSSYTWMPNFAALIGASSLADNPDYQTITFTASTFPNGDPTNVLGRTLNFGQGDQDVVSPGSCVILDNYNEASILDGGNKYVLYLGDSVSSVSDLTPSGTLGTLFNAYYNMAGGGGKANGTIPGPGFSTWVYYYINATNQIGETNTSITYSYYVDGFKPVVTDCTSVTGLISSEEKVTISANVTDDYYLGNVLLWYNNGSGWTSIVMNFISGDSTNATYQVDIPPARSQTTVDYFIQVFDRANNSNSSAIKNFSTNSPPIIRDVKNIPEFPKGSSIVSVLANVTDTDGIFTVTLYYSTDGVTYTSTSMTSPGGNTYNGTIPPPGFTTDVFYYIESTDNIGLSNTTPIFTYLADSDPPWFDPPTIYPQYPNATNNVNVTIGIMDNAKVTNATLHYTYDGITWFNTAMIDFGVSGTFYENKVESGPLGWTHYQSSSPAPDNWHIDSARYYSFWNSWHSGPEPGGNNGSTCLESPLFTNLPSYTNLTFWHWYNFYPFPTDGGIVEINDGSGWSQIFPVNGYDATLNIGWLNPLEGKPAFTGGSGGWQKETFVLSAYAGKDVRIRFHIGWNIINDGGYEGWYIDDITLYSDIGGWSGIIPGPGFSTWVYYYVVASDPASNMNNTITYSYFIDGNHPVVSDISDVTSPVATYAQVSIFTNVTDDYGLDFNNVYLWYDNGGGWTKVPMNFISGNFTQATFQAFISPSNIETTVYYYVEVVDNASNSNISITKSYLTNAPPFIKDVNHQPQYPNGTGTVTVYANLTDSDGIGSATLYYSTDGIIYTPVTMTFISGNAYSGIVPASGPATLVYYYIEATDNNGFLNSTSIFTFQVDTEPPQLGLPSRNPQNPNATVNVNISVGIWDNIALENAYLWYRYDNTMWSKLTMSTASNMTISGRNPSFGTTTGDLSATYSFNDQFIISLYVYVYSSDNDTLRVDIQGYNQQTKAWETIYFSSTGPGGVKVDTTYSNPVYTKWKIFLDDTENNDQIYYQYSYSVANAYGIIPGPGYPTKVYYYIEAVDLAGNTNTSGIYWYIVGPDLMLAPQNITFNPYPAENGTNIQINATIYNGGGDLTGVEVRFYNDNPDIDNDNIIDVGAKEIGSPAIINVPGNTASLASTFWTPPKRDSYDIYVWADPLNATWEWNEWNNLASNKLVVYDWVDNFLDESRIEYKNDITIADGDATLRNIGNSISVTGNSNQYSVGGNWGSDYYAQSFIATDPFISSVGIYIGGDSSPFPDMRVQLWGDLGGNPNKNNIIASGDVILGSTITWTGQRYYINFSTPLPVTINQRYWVVIDGWYDHNTTGDCKARRNTLNTYPNGVFKVSNNAGSTWFIPSSNYDLDFIVTFYQPVLNGNLRSVKITLPLGHVWETLFIDKTEPSNNNIYVSVMDGDTNNLITGFTDLTDNIIDISLIDPELYPSIKLEAKFNGDGTTSPALHYWAINWVPSPKADAGPDDSVDEDKQYTFNGSGSWSSVGIASYAWDMDANNGIDWINPDYKGYDLWNPTHTYYTPGVYIVTLNVTDINGYWDIDTMILTVIDRTDPVADAGSDDQTDEDSPYTFDASGSWDNSGTIVSFLWDVDASDGVDWNNPDYTGVSPTHIFYEPGTYLVTLKVLDAEGNWKIDTITIIVIDITPPIANAGVDASINEDDTYEFDGSRSNDNVGIIFYNWTFGDGSYQFGTNLTPIHTYSYEGRYVVALKVTDEAGNWNVDTITVFVNNLPPIADAGEDQIIHQGQMGTFDGSNSSDTPSDEPYLTYVWYFGDGFVGAGKVITHTYSEPGVYTVTLIVTDNNGAIGSDTLTVAIKDATWPTANAGRDDSVDQNIPYQFDGRASTDDVGIVKYQWDINSRDGIDWSSPDYEGATPTHVYTEPGVYVVTLRVIDGDGNYDIDKITITVKETPVIAKVPCEPTDLEVLLTPEVDALNICWHAPTEYEDGSPLTESELDHYEIFYRIGENQEFQKLCDVPAGTNSHIHSDLMTDVMYYYYVVAVDRELTRSEPSITVGRMPNADTDGDQVPDTIDEDDDNDGYPDILEILGNSDSKDASSKPADYDGDLLPDVIDADDDDDGHLDSEDDYPLDETKWRKGEDGFIWLWILLGLIVALLVIIALLVWKLTGPKQEPIRAGKPKEGIRGKRVVRRPPKTSKPTGVRGKPKTPTLPPPPPPPPPPLSALPTEEVAPQEEEKSVEEAEAEVEWILDEELPKQPIDELETEKKMVPPPLPGEGGITEKELPEQTSPEFESEEKTSKSPPSPKGEPTEEELTEPKTDEQETEE